MKITGEKLGEKLLEIERLSRRESYVIINSRGEAELRTRRDQTGYSTKRRGC